LFFSVEEPTGGPGATDGTEQVAVNLSQFPPPMPLVLTDWETQNAQPMAGGTRMIYLEQVNADTGAGELRVVGVGGAKPVQPVRLHAALTGTQSASYGAHVPRDGSFAVFSIDNYNGPNTSRLYRAKMNADGPLPPEPLTDGTQHVDEVTLSPDGKRVLYTLGQKSLSSDTALYVSDVSGATVGAPVKVNGPLVAGGSLFPPFGAVGAAWSPDSQHVAYIADALQKGLREAFLVDVVNAPGNAKRLNTSLPAATSAVTGLRFSPDGRWLALYGDLDVAHVNGIYLVPLGASGPGLPQKVAETLAANEDLPFNIAWAPDASYFGYTVYNGNTQTYRAGVVAPHDNTLSAPMPVGGTAHITSLAFLSAGF
jgi:Tol biopolymer transport system component